MLHHPGTSNNFRLYPMKLFFLLSLLVLPLTLSCDRFVNNHNEPVAKVHNNYLYREDIAELLPAGISEADSAKIAKNYIDKWIRNQLFLRLAEMNLPAEEKDVTKQIENFRATMLIYKYQQYMLGQKLDTLISVREIEDYYKNHINNFVLEKPAIRGVYVQVPADTPGTDRLLTWFRNGNDNMQIENFIDQYAFRNIWFNDSYIYLEDILTELPPISVTDANLRNTDHLTTTDSQYFYFIGIEEYLPSKSQMPLSIASQKIKSIILNKRKMQFLNELEKNVFNEGLNKNTFQYF